MITEDYVSFEIAKLLKEKGFSENTEHKIWYAIKQFSTGCHWNSCTYKVGDTTREYDNDCCIPMPTLQMAMKWLRKEHYCHIIIDYTFTADANLSEEYVSYCYNVENAKTYIQYTHNEWYNTYEEACELAIKYCLENLI